MSERSSPLLGVHGFIPAGSYAVTGHRGPDVQASYQRAFERAFHHIERHSEPVLRDELESEIWVRLHSGDTASS